MAVLSKKLFNIVKIICIGNKVCSFSATRYNITHVLLVTLVCKNKYRAPSRCIHDPTFRHSSLVSSSGVMKTLDLSVETLGREYTSKELCIYFYKPE